MIHRPSKPDVPNRGRSDRTSARGWRGIAALVAAVLLAAALAGCASDTTTGGGGGGMVAAEGIDTAKEEAAGWDDEATLINVAAFETPTEDTPLPDENSSEALDLNPRSVDGDVADGRTERWAYQFEAPAKEADLIVVVHADGSTETETMPPEEESFPVSEVTAPTITSPEALQAAAAHETIADVLAEDDAAVLVLLFNPDGQTWMVNAYSEATGADEVVFVDAETGEVSSF